MKEVDEVEHKWCISKIYKVGVDGMIVQCYLWNGMEIHFELVELNDESTFEDLVECLIEKNLLNQGRIDCDNLYEIKSLRYSWNNLLYIISDGKVIWEPNDYDVKLKDLFKTYDLKDYTILIKHGREIEIGGLEVIYMIDAIWDLVLKVVQTGILIVGLRKWIAYKRLRKETKKDGTLYINPTAVLSFILSRDRWNINELMSLTEFDKDTSKGL